MNGNLANSSPRHPVLSQNGTAAQAAACCSGGHIQPKPDRVSKNGTTGLLQIFSEKALPRGFFAKLSQIGTKATRESEYSKGTF